MKLFIKFQSFNFQHDCEESYEKSKITLRMREEALKKARESCLRTESSPPEREASRRRRDLEKKSRAVEEAMIKVRVFHIRKIKKNHKTLCICIHISMFHNLIIFE